MDWGTGMQRAIDYIERHLEEDIDPAQAAREAACSAAYFQRVFGILCGMTLGEYVRSRRLALAGQELMATGVRVTELALKYGYETPESFSRAFRRFHGILPSEAARGQGALRSFSPLSIRIAVEGGTQMEYRLVRREAFAVLERARRFPVEQLPDQRSVRRFWEESERDGTLTALLREAADGRLLGICRSEGMPEGMAEYAIAVQKRQGVLPSPGIRQREIPAAQWAAFPCTGPVPEAICRQWRRIYEEFFPATGYRPAQGWDMEAYPGEGDARAADCRSEIWVPLEER